MTDRTVQPTRRSHGVLAAHRDMGAPRVKVRILSFNDDPAKRAALYACGDCGRCFSPKNVGEQNAIDFAEKCCAPVHCSGCGVEVGSPWTACASCREKNKLRRATPIPESEWSGPVEYEGMSGSWGEGYSGNTGELLQAWEDEGLQVPPPAYCWPCISQDLRLDPDSLLEQAVDGMHEDAADQIVGADGFYEFIKAWNAKQTCKSWYPDHSRVVVLDQKRFDELLGETKQ